MYTWILLLQLVWQAFSLTYILYHLLTSNLYPKRGYWLRKDTKLVTMSSWVRMRVWGPGSYPEGWCCHPMLHILVRDHEADPDQVFWPGGAGQWAGRIDSKGKPVYPWSLWLQPRPSCQLFTPFPATCGQAGHCREPGACRTKRQFMNRGYFVCLLESTKICHLCG